MCNICWLFSLQQSYDKALDNVCDVINPRTRRDAPSSVTCATTRRSVAVDVMPALRLMSKSEQLREIAKTKRR